VENTPLFEGSLVTTGDDGRAEIQFEDGSVVRLSPNSSLTLAVLRGQGSSAEAEIALETAWPISSCRAQAWPERFA
jgi:hypothetical protein